MDFDKKLLLILAIHALRKRKITFFSSSFLSFCHGTEGKEIKGGKWSGAARA